jgi:protein-disulfide isomerase
MTGTAMNGTAGETDGTDARVREMVQRRHRRRRTLLVSLAAGALVVGAALVGAGLVRANNTAPDKAPDRVPAAVAADDKAGLELTDGTTAPARAEGTVRVDVYLDFLCPECRRTEKALTSALHNLRVDGDVRVVYHPVSFLDKRSSPAGYSTRAASAAACAADQGRFEQYSAELFDRQPPEGGPGLSEAQLIAAGEEAGLTGTRATTFERCVQDRTYTPWASYVTDYAASRKIALTPTVLVAGERVDVTGSDPAAALGRAVREARG